MISEHIFNAITNFQEIMGIPISFYAEGVLAQTFLIPEFPHNPCATIIEKTSSFSEFIFTISYNYLYCGKIQCPDSNTMFLIGPIPGNKYTNNQIAEIAKELQIPISQNVKFSKWLRMLPIMEQSIFQNIMKYLNFLICGDKSRKLIYAAQPASESDISLSYDEFLKDGTGLPYEKQLLGFIEHGKPEMIRSFLNQLQEAQHSLPDTMGNLSQSYCNICIRASALFSRACVKGGVDYETAVWLDNLYCRKAYAVESYPQMELLFRNMAEDFAMHVKKVQQLKTTTRIVQRIIHYIHVHIYEKITLDKMSYSLNLNKSYLCRHFHDQTGLTIISYINQAKIQESKLLLKLSDMTICEISHTFGFSSQNYFQTVFKQITGMTPCAYRRITVS